MQDVKFFYEGKNFVVVGASSGIGKQIALDLSQAGANVLCLARRVKKIEQMKVEQGLGKIIPAFIDVISATADDWDAIIKNFVKSYGKISGGVYTAGITGLTTLRCFEEDLAKRIMDTSYWGMLRFIQVATKKRFVYDGSSFIVFSSTAAHLGNEGLIAYAASKSAVMSAVQSIAKDIYKNRHRINSISPGFVDTPMVHDVDTTDFNVYEKVKPAFLLGEGTVDKVSGMVLFLLSSKSDWITGTDIVIDGGQLLHGGGCK